MKKRALFWNNFCIAVCGIFSVFLCSTEVSNYEFTDVIVYNAILPIVYPLLFILFGYGLQTQQISFCKTAKRMLIWYAASITIFLCLSAIYQIVNNSFLIRTFMLNCLFVFTKGVPNALWFIPAVLISGEIFFATKKKVSVEKLLFPSFFLYVFSCFILTYSSCLGGSFSLLYGYATAVFGEKHGGVFSVLFFVVIGAYIGHKPQNEKNSKKKIIILIACFLSLVLELTFVKNMNLSFNSLFYFTSPLFAVSLFNFLPKDKNSSFHLSEIGIFGESALIAGQTICSCVPLLPALSVFFSNSIYQNRSIEREFALLLSFILGVFIYVVTNKKKPYSNEICRSIRRMVFNIGLPFAFIMTVFKKKTRDNIIRICFAILPFLLWCTERELYPVICSKLFKLCLTVIVLCCCQYRNKMLQIKTSVFLSVFFTSCLIIVSSCLFGLLNYLFIGNIILFFVFPVALICSYDESITEKFLKLYTDGIYISYAAYFVYCSMFRPYDITRYKGAFCNANMNGLYLVVVLVCAIYRLHGDFSLKKIKSSFLDTFVFGSSFAFILFSISRTALAGAVCASGAVIVVSVFSKKQINSKTKIVRNFLSNIIVIGILIPIGTVLTYACIRVIPAIVDRPIFLQREIHELMEYKVRQGASFFDPEYISPKRFITAFLSRSAGSFENVNDFSTGRIDIYKAYINSLSLFGHSSLRIPIPNEVNRAYAHNAFLQIAFNLGIITGISWLGIILYIWFKTAIASKKGKTCAIFSVASIAAYASCGLFESMETFIYPLLFIALISIIPLFSSFVDHSIVVENNNEISELAGYKVKIVFKKIIAVFFVLFFMFAFFWFLGNLGQGEGFELLQKTLYGE